MEGPADGDGGDGVEVSGQGLDRSSISYRLEALAIIVSQVSGLRGTPPSPPSPKSFLCNDMPRF